MAYIAYKSIQISINLEKHKQNNKPVMPSNSPFSLSRTTYRFTVSRFC